MKYILVNDSSGQIEDFVQFNAENVIEARVKMADLLIKKDKPESFHLYEVVGPEGRQLVLDSRELAGQLIIHDEVAQVQPGQIEKVYAEVTKVDKKSKKQFQNQSVSVSAIVQDEKLLAAAQERADDLKDTYESAALDAMENN